MQQLISNLPEPLIHLLLVLRKRIRRIQLLSQKKSGKIITRDRLISDFQKAGIYKGSVVMVHSSLSKIGMVEGGAKTVIDALLNVIGDSGTLLMPSFPAPGKNYDYLEKNKTFDALLTVSRMGIITEYFRHLPGVKRSLHPTDPVSALGPLADYFIEGHLNQLTPYNQNSPFYRITEKKGTILMLGTTLNGACTSLHLLEDAVDFPYPVYADKIFDVDIKDEFGKIHHVKTKVHNPAYSVKRNADVLKKMFIDAGVLKEVKIGQADSLLIDAKGMLDCMIDNFNRKGITMYTPYGNGGHNT